ncbi:BamA/TamA family outer membrane protein [Myxococcota bacterium]|nr:BamA/TamA family outer membrane protein [Myxococcota bacterium]
MQNLSPRTSLGAVVRCLALFAALAAARPAEAAGPYDPEVPYKTLETENFLVMFPVGYEHIALRSGTIAERVMPKLVERYGWQPDGRTSIIINDQTDFANGSATILPSKVVTIYVTAPTEVSGLEEYDDWLTTVITHELAHIIHLDMAYGLPWLGRLIFGKYVSMNQYNPAWVTEGLAVYEETMSSGAGRGRSSYVDMVVRMASLEDVFPGIDQGYRGYPNWPFSNVAYFLGGRFQLWLRERFGEEALMRYHRAYASNPIPYFPWVASEIAFDRGLEGLWDEFRAEMLADSLRAKELIAAHPMGVTEPQRLTRYGGDVLGPRITPDGQKIIFSTSSPVDGARVRRVNLDGSGDEVLVDDTFSKALSFTPDGKAFYFQQTEINQRFYAHNSLMRYDLVKEKFARVDVDPTDHLELLASSGSLRARDPDVSPDGRRIVFVQSPYGANRLVIAWLESDGTTIHPRELVKAEPDVELSDPRFSPDGKLIACSRFAGGRRDLVLYDLEGRLVEQLTRDRAQDGDPTWSRDGRWIVFSSDRTGVYNLYAWDTSKRELVQLTNLVGGAYQPSLSPDDRFIVYRGYSAEGFDVYRVPFEPEKGHPVSQDLEPEVALDITPRRWPWSTELAPEIPPPAPFTGAPMPERLPEGWSIDDYSSLDTILPFHDNWNLFPLLYANESEILGSLTHFGADAMDTQSYALNVTYATKTRFVGGSVAYFNDMLEPTFGIIGAASSVRYERDAVIVPVGSAPCVGDERSSDGSFCYGTPSGRYDQRRLGAGLSIGLPFLQRHRFTLGYSFERRESIEDLPATALPELLPRAGNFARASIGYSYANVRAFAHSVSLERGRSFSVALSALSKGLGSDYEEFLLTTEGRFYLSMPWTTRWLRNHVFATRLALGLSGGPDSGAEEFRLGGFDGASALTTTTDDFYGLRGFRTGALRGASLVLGSFEYRAPLLRVDRGLNVPGFFGPLVLEVFHLALFADVGRTFDGLDPDVLKDRFLEGFAVGVGAELRADITLFYNLPLRLVVGYALPAVTPTNQEFRTSPENQGPYFQLGSTF